MALPFGLKLPARAAVGLETAKAAVSALAMESLPIVTEKLAGAQGLFLELRGLPQKPLKDWAKNLGPAGTARMLRAINVWPPFVGAGIRVSEVADDLSRLRVEMGLYPWNRNWVGTQYGGSLYSMTDPFAMIMLMTRLGPGYVVWDKAASIQYRKPGKGAVSAEIELSEYQVEAIRREADELGKSEPTFDIAILGQDGEVVALVHRRLSVRRKGHPAAKKRR